MDKSGEVTPVTKEKCATLTRTLNPRNKQGEIIIHRLP